MQPDIVAGNAIIELHEKVTVALFDEEKWGEGHENLIKTNWCKHIELCINLWSLHTKWQAPNEIWYIQWK